MNAEPANTRFQMEAFPRPPGYVKRSSEYSLMLEIILVIVLCKALGNLLRAKGRKPFWLQVMLVFSWIAGEFAAGVVAGIVHVIRYGEDAPMGFGIYLFAIVGAALGAGFTFFIAYMLPAQNSQSLQEIASNDAFERRLDPNNPYAP